jgi:acyl-CoA hydrolase
MPESKREVTLRFLAQPTDVNFGGKVHGGSVMKWLDQAGYVCASAWSGNYCVTAFVGDMNFHSPVRVGELVEVTARVIHTGRSSMHIALDLLACPPADCRYSKALRCIMVFISVDENGESVAVPSWRPSTPEDLAMEQYALKIMELRKINQEALDALKL